MKHSDTKQAKEPVRIRFKELADGTQSIYLDIYRNGKRSYKFLKLYLLPETTPDAKAANHETMAQAEKLKAEKVREISELPTVHSEEKTVEHHSTPKPDKSKPAKKKAGRVAKEPVTLRAKDIANGRQSLYLDIYIGRVRKYEFLKLYLEPEVTEEDKENNLRIRAAADRIKEQRLLEITAGTSVEEEERCEEICDKAEDDTDNAPETKNSIVIRKRKLRNGNRSLFLDIFYGECRATESLGLYLTPDDSEELKKRIMAKANAARRQVMKEIEAGTYVRQSERSVSKARVDKYKEYQATKKVVSEIAAVETERKRNSKTKEPVRIRFKELANGNRSVYLSINHNGRRSYDYLKMYLVPETDANARMQNKMTMQAVYAIKAQRIMDIVNGAAAIKDKTRIKMRFVDWLEIFRDCQVSKGRPSAYKWVNCLIKAIKNLSANITIGEITREFCNDFVIYMMNDYRTYKDTHPSKGTVLNYLKCIKAAMNMAIEEGIVNENPVNRINTEALKDGATKREYLTVEEVKKLIDTPCKRPDIKAAFLFSCFCGLRVSDVRALKWRNVITENGKIRVEILQYKTRQPLYLPLNQQALHWMPERGDAGDDDKVFSTLPEHNLDIITSWAKKAGITKHVTYHVSRHTFATMELTMGADLYTTSKLLGHTDVRTTQIYAKIINSKKYEAVSLLDSAF